MSDTTQNELELLLKQKDALYARTDLDPEEKDRLARRLRRQIRNVRGGDNSGSGSPDEPQRQSRARRSGKNPGHLRLAASTPDEFVEFKAEVQAWLTDIGIEWKDPADLVSEHLPAMGIDLVYMYEHDVTGDQLIEKFHHRWADKHPKWFSIRGQNIAEILCLGPLPAGMVQG